MPAPEMKRDDILAVNSSNYRNAFMGKPISHLIYQALTVQDVPGKTVEKGTDTTDDVFRAMVVAHALLNEPEVAELVQGELRNGNYGIGAVAGMSGGYGGSSVKGHKSVNIPIAIGGSGAQSIQGSRLGVLGRK